MAMQDRDLSRIEVLDDAMAEVLRTKTEAERLAIAHRLWEHARSMLEAMVRREHPQWTDEEVGREVARRLSHGVPNP